jgi:outer membrane immunogenic protein
MTMIKKLLLSSAVATAMIGSALAADLPSRKGPPPEYVPPPVFLWTGFYVGINGGGIWNSGNVVTTGQNLGIPLVPFILTGGGLVDRAAAAAASNVINPSRVGFLGGAQWGYNWQINSFVLGTESDFQGVFTDRNCGNNGGGFGGGFGNNNNCTAVTVAPVIGPFAVRNTQVIDRRMDYFGTSRVRAGFLPLPNLLIYATGGVAYGQVRLNTTTISQLTLAGAALPAVLFGPGTSTFNYSHIKVGFTGGGGIEWMFLPNWSVKAEALYYDLGRSSISQNFTQTFLPTILGIPIARTNTITTWRNNGVIARAGINYHFSWGAAAPVVARY